jgi:hypothetical protein
MRIVGDRRVPESDEDSEALVRELKDKVTVFDMGKLSLEDHVMVRRAMPSLVEGIRLRSRLPSNNLFLSYL